MSQPPDFRGEIAVALGWRSLWEQVRLTNFTVEKESAISMLNANVKFFLSLQAALDYAGKEIDVAIEIFEFCLELL
ncbi:hypothetical protein JJD41_04295 [Oxynema sp. CENA135]|uniref:hypothetical protein n=1 Tax=Oxynema sp. CENA135 TaxID=984206 RepID=UPI00190AE429|nr:hypothetical protein [Oxynema sp. CENA135]MBK4729111.1 hypothetical protein [Oxynema sp. CENA135]